MIGNRRPTHGRAFADDLPRRDLNPNEAKVLCMAIKPEVGKTFCSNWDITDFKGEPVTVGFVSRVPAEPGRRIRTSDLPSDELAQRA